MDAFGNLPTRTFELGDVLSAATGMILSPRYLDGIFDVLGFMVQDENITKVGFSLVGEQVGTEVLRQHPELNGKVPEPGEIVSQETANAFVAKTAAELGVTEMELTALPADAVKMDLGSIFAHVKSLNPDIEIIPVIVDRD